VQPGSRPSIDHRKKRVFFQSRRSDPLHFCRLHLGHGCSQESLTHRLVIECTLVVLWIAVLGAIAGSALASNIGQIELRLASAAFTPVRGGLFRLY